MSGSKSWYSAHLDSENCLDLDQILRVFSAPITEEHAWAVIYQSLSCLERKLGVEGDSCYTVTTARDILLHTDGSVHGATFTKRRLQRQMLISENTAVADLGVVIYDALDYSLPEDEQRTLSPGLEEIIDKMTSADDEEEDEGIGDEVDVKKTGLCSIILELCRLHLAMRREADSHYKSVCRALVAEALEISFFMARVNLDEENQELKDLDMKDWASLWGQMMQQLRQGIKLKKVNFSKTPSEFGLTPYEMLLEDIKTCRYKLNPVQVSPKVKTDANDKILDFIRSRPPLKPVSERVLPPRKRKESTARELILEDIVSGQGREGLRKVERKFSKTEREKQRKRKNAVQNANYHLKVIPDTEISSNTSEQVKKASPKTAQRKQNRAKSVQFSKSPVQISKSSPTGRKLSKQKKHSSQIDPKTNQKNNESLPTILKPAKPVITKETKYSSWTESLASLNLNLEEVSHIRNALTKAELEDKNFDEEFHQELLTGKTCFICMTVKFGIISWGYNCKICTKYVCGSCCSTLKLPHDRLNEITVASLIPQLSLSTNVPPSPSMKSPMSPGVGLLRNTFNRLSFRSSNQSPRPAMARSKTMGRDEIEKVKVMKLSPTPKQVTPSTQLVNVARPQLTRSNTMGAGEIERLRSLRLPQGTSCTVCKDCRQMLTDKLEAMKRGESVEHRNLML